MFVILDLIQITKIFLLAVPLLSLYTLDEDTITCMARLSHFVLLFIYLTITNNALSASLIYLFSY